MWSTSKLWSLYRAWYNSITIPVSRMVQLSCNHEFINFVLIIGQWSRHTVLARLMKSAPFLRKLQFLIKMTGNQGIFHMWGHKYVNRLLASTDSPFLYYDDSFPLHEAPSGKKMYPLLKWTIIVLIIGTLRHERYYYKVVCNQRHYWGYMTN